MLLCFAVMSARSLADVPGSRYRAPDVIKRSFGPGSYYDSRFLLFCRTQYLPRMSFSSAGSASLWKRRDRGESQDSQRRHPTTSRPSQQIFCELAAGRIGR
ncbi:hypothetical protein C8T65DRAFT_83118 [Cerioporus squamosus]|nr:hypothetical protein C8T65DRAFT_83118 [Cerioporus squamosus]